MNHHFATYVLSGKICTMRKGYQEIDWAESLAIQNENIVYVGSRDGVERFIGPKTELIDVGQGMILPGFQDAHVHPLAAGLTQIQCVLSFCETLQEALQTIRDYSQKNSHLPWITGFGFQKFWFSNEIASAKILDSVVPDRPAVFISFDAHSAWANTLAMKFVGITRETSDPPGGSIVKDQNGDPIGHFDESAVKFFEKYVGMGIWDDNKETISLDQKLQALHKAINQKVSCGITAFQDAIVRPGNLEAYELAARTEQLPIKASLCLWWDCNSDTQQIQWMKEARERCKQLKNLRVSSVKFMLDGVMETKTAHLQDSYFSPHPIRHPHGLALFTLDQMKEYFVLLDKEGFQIHCHAVGDGACSNALTAFQYVNEVNGPTSCRTHRHEIAHLQLVQPKDLSRFSQLGVAANFQPYWSHPDRDMIEITEPLLGPERSTWQYPIRTLLHQGTTVGFGSDWFVSPLEPLTGIQIAVTHQTLDGESIVWNPKERLTLLEALYCYTVGSAHLNFLEKETGSIEVGKKADLVILSENLFTINPNNIHKVLVLYTFCNGKIVYKRPNY